jgi:hypothetical protein
VCVYIYDSRSNKNQKTSKNKTAMIASRVANESIRNMNETEDSIKIEMKYAKQWNNTQIWWIC